MAASDIKPWDRNQFCPREIETQGEQKLGIKVGFGEWM